MQHIIQDSRHSIEIQQVDFGTLDFNDSFFDSFKQDYGDYYADWFAKKAKDKVYCIFSDDGLAALLKLKIEVCAEDFEFIHPELPAKRRLKISSLKIDSSLKDLGIFTRFLQIIMRKAQEERAEEIYFTIVVNNLDKIRLTHLFRFNGFTRHGFKSHRSCFEECWVHPMQL